MRKFVGGVLALLMVPSLAAAQTVFPNTGGTVKSVTGSGGTTGLTLSGGPITTTGTLTLGGTLGVANGGTNCTAASITCFNNITGLTAAGTTGTTSSSLVFSASPTLTGTLSAAAEVLTTSSATGFSVGPAGTTNPTFNIDASTASSATGIQVKSAAAAGGVAVSVLSSGSNENLAIDAKGSGTITLGGTSTGGIVVSRALTYGGVALSNAVTGTGNMVLSASPTFSGTTTFTTIAATSGITSSNNGAGVGYKTGAGGAVTQASSRSTGVTLSTITGAITLVSAVGSPVFSTFTVTNTKVVATDVVILSQKSGTDKYELFVSAVAAGSFDITLATTGGTTTEQPVISFAIIKAVTS